MGFAKYHEDNLEIIDERMYYRNAPSLPSVQSSYIITPPKIKYKFFCPLCNSGFATGKNLVDHIISSHGGNHEFVFLNNRRVYDNEKKVSQVYSLKLFSFRDTPREIKLQDGTGEKYSFWTRTDTYEYDIQSILQSHLYSELLISNIDKPICIKQQLDINNVSIDKIFAGKYQSYLFDEQISEEMLSPKECLIYLKMLIYEGSDTRPFLDRIDYMHLDACRELQELYYYQLLYMESVEGIEEKLSVTVAKALLLLLSGEYTKADAILNASKGDKNDRYGCMIIIGLLRNDKSGVSYLTQKYNPYGFIGILEQVLLHFSMYEKNSPKLLIQELNELKIFDKYPLIKAVADLSDAINHRTLLSYKSYSLLRELTPLAAILYCNAIDTPEIKEKILKSTVKTHEDSALLKEYAFPNDYGWLKRRIHVSDGELYRKAVYKENERRGCILSKRFLDNFPFDDQIQITPLGGEHEIGASCFVISYKGYNIMLDCGINVQKHGDEAYPDLDLWDRGIDTIVISHAHIDHSGGVPKAHAMWADAGIIATAPTKVFLKYLYSDMAKVKNGISNEFEIENISIEKDVMLETLNSMTTVNYEEWINLSRDIKLKLHPAGHIIGAAMVELRIKDKTILYTGDFCNYNQMLAGKADLSVLPRNVDYLITESTYFKKRSVDWGRQYEELRSALLREVNAHHAILLPAASVGRSQELVCLIGEMKLSGEIPASIPLYLAGMAIPATTQLVPFMNERYASILGQYNEFDGITYPEDNAIVIASSGSMSKGSASYKIARYWDNRWVKYSIIANGYLDEDSEADSRYMDKYSQVKRLSLSTHADLKGIFELIDFVSPKVISFVHRGSGSAAEFGSLIHTSKSKFSNDIVCLDLQANRGDKVFDIYNWLMEGEEK